MRVDTTDKTRFEFGLDKPLELKGDWAVTADWHVPLYDANFVFTAPHSASFQFGVKFKTHLNDWTTFQFV